MAEGWKIEKTGHSHRLGHGAKQGPIDISHYLEDFQFLGTRRAPDRPFGIILRDTDTFLEMEGLNNI